jgi:hypothetical protein
MVFVPSAAPSDGDANIQELGPKGELRLSLLVMQRVGADGWRLAKLSWADAVDGSEYDDVDGLGTGERESSCSRRQIFA